MLNTLFSDPTMFVVVICALLLAITVHEFAHAFVADKLGDPTPRMQGRLTLNPLAHLDPVGTIMMLLVGFGWGKPVVFDPYNLKSPRRDAALISLAGPVSNLITASLLAVILHILTGGMLPFSPLTKIFLPFIFLNIVLAIFNLIPIHPLDGGKILVGLLPQHDAYEFDKFLNRYGLLLLLFLVFPIFGTSAASRIISPVVNFILSFLLPIGNLT